MDICVVTYRNTADRIVPAVRQCDHLWVRDNTDDNIGFGAACNELASEGTDEVILFVNPDGDPQPGCFDLLEKCVMQTNVIAAEASLGPWWDDLWEPRSDDRNSWLTGACLAVRRDVFEKVGGFDPTLFLYYEDVDLSWKLAKHGQLVSCREAVFLHDPKERGNSLRAEFFVARNKLIVSRRWGKPWGTKDGLKQTLLLVLRLQPLRALTHLAAVVGAIGHT